MSTTTITLIVRKQEHQLPANQTVAQAIQQLGLPPESYLAVRNGEMITEKDLLRAGDVVRLIPVISGGSAGA